MTPTDKASTPKIKIKRKRKRMYDPIDSDSVSASTKASDAKDIPDKKKPASSDTKKQSNKTAARGTSATLIQAREIVKKYSFMSAGSGVIPIPVVDLVAVSAIEYKMLKELCRQYENEFSKERVKVLISALVGGFHAGLFIRSFFKWVPAIGLAMSTASSVALSGAITYAIGMVFIKHFESGGTLLDFDPEKYKNEFNQNVSQQTQK